MKLAAGTCSCAKHIPACCSKSGSGLTTTYHPDEVLQAVCFAQQYAPIKRGQTPRSQTQTLLLSDHARRRALPRTAPHWQAVHERPSSHPAAARYPCMHARHLHTPVPQKWVSRHDTCMPISGALTTHSTTILLWQCNLTPDSLSSPSPSANAMSLACHALGAPSHLSFPAHFYSCRTSTLSC